MDKKTLRQQIRSRKQMLSDTQISAASARLGEKLAQSPMYRQADAIYGYLSYNQEVRTQPILLRAMEDGKRVAVPKVYGNEMKFIYLTDLNQVAPGYAGIPEPVTDDPVAGEPDALVLMPGLAFDPEGHRIGYGGGFYDRFLAKEPQHPTIALCYDFQMFPHLETEEFDRLVDCVLWTEIGER